MSMKMAVVAAAALAVLTGPTLSANAHAAGARMHATRGPQSDPPPSGFSFDPGVRAAVGPGYDFRGWPTDYLINRFGDRQLQGR